jgi:hypothetical protein
LNSNSTVATLDGTPVSLDSDWALDFENGITFQNQLNGNLYSVTLKTPDLSITFIRKVYMVVGLENQWHFDYKARMFQDNSRFHGYVNFLNVA